MGVYKIPLRFTAGSFKFSELGRVENCECLELDYDDEYQMITYNAPMYGSEVHIYTVPRKHMPNALSAVYGSDGILGKVEFSEGERKRLFYIRFKHIDASERGVLKFVREQADIDYYKGDITAADNYGNFNNRIPIDLEALGVMLMCTNGDFRSMLFYKAVETFEERLKNRVLDKIGKTEDFKFISEEYD